MRNIRGLARAALEREEQVREYWVRSQDVGQFSGGPYRKAAVAARARVWQRRFPGEPSRITPYYARPTTVLRPLTIHLQPLTIDLQQLEPGHAGGRAGAKRMQTATGMRRARSTLAATFGSMPLRSAVTEMLTAGASSPSPQHWRGPARDASRGRWQAPPPRPSPSNQCPAERRTATTLTRPLLSAVCNMCRTFQKSSVSRVVRPCRDCMLGTLSSESRRRVSSRTARVSPKLRDAWMAEVTTVTGASAVGG